MVLDKIKSLKGILYRKFVKAKEEKEVELPGFKIRKPLGLEEIPSFDDIRKVNVIYPLIEPFAYAHIKWNKEREELVYDVIEPRLSEEEEKILKDISEALIELVEVGLSAIKEEEKVIEYLETRVKKIIKDLGIKISPAQYVKIMYFIYRNFVGFNQIEPLLKDPNIEDISCDGVNLPIYVVHRKYGSVKTNVMFKSVDELREFVVKLAERCGRYVSYAEPILDGTLPDGSRVSATLASDIAMKGPSFTIRKFGEKPFSPIDIIELGTADAEILAYFWFLVEHRASILIVGGTATGKTSFLNTICMFIPPEAKIVSIEDTREIQIPHEHWIPGLTRVGFGIPLPTGEKYGSVSMFDLLKESFRQNPDYIIVGETRGKETYVMFQGMASGHCCLSTFHAGSVDTVVKRLTTPPIELSPTLLESLSIITVMIRAKEKGKSARRIKEIVEIVSVDPKTKEVYTNTVFWWNPTNDTFNKVTESVVVRRIAESIGISLEEALKDIERRKVVLEWLKNMGIRDYKDVIKYINLYHKNPKKLMRMMEKKVVEEKEEVVEKVVKETKKVRRPSILEIMGFKIIREG